MKEASDCFAACYALRCRSANFVANGKKMFLDLKENGILGKLNTCELYRDSLIDYRRPDILEFAADTVYFDGINCDGTRP